MNRLPILNWTKFILVAITIFGDHVSFGQFQSIPDSNAIWVQSILEPNYFDDHFTYYLNPWEQDTLINDTSYSMLYGYDNWGNWPGEFKGGLYDNSLGQVYYYYPDSGRSFLLYDFDVLPGDSVESIWFQFSHFLSPVMMYIDSVDILSVGGVQHKRVCFHSQYGYISEDCWIQGIGGNNGLMETSGTDHFQTYSLECMSSNDTTWWLGYTGWGQVVGDPGNCSPTSVTEGFWNGRPEISILRDIVPGTFTIAYSQALTIEIFSSTGALVVETNGLSFEISQQPPGIYIVRLRGKEYVWSQKIVR